MLGGALQLGIVCEEAWTPLVAAEWSGRSGPLQAVLHFRGVNLWFPHYGLPHDLLGELMKGRFLDSEPVRGICASHRLVLHSRLLQLCRRLSLGRSWRNAAGLRRPSAERCAQGAGGGGRGRCGVSRSGNCRSGALFKSAVFSSTFAANSFSPFPFQFSP